MYPSVFLACSKGLFSSIKYPRFGVYRKVPRLEIRLNQ